MISKSQSWYTKGQISWRVCMCGCRDGRRLTRNCIDLLNGVSGNFQSRCVRGRKIHIYNNSGSDEAERKSSGAADPCRFFDASFAGNKIYEKEAVMNQRPLLVHTHAHTFIYGLCRMSAHKELRLGGGG